MRARLDRDTGDHDNQIIWSSHEPLQGDYYSGEAAFLLLDKWVAAIKADTNDLPLEDKVVANKPATAVDACWIGGKKVTDLTVCRAVLPYFSTPRLTAGAPATDDVMKCQLKPLDRADYTVTFSDAQWDRLNQAFPTGVCDYRKSSVGQQANITWLDYSTGQTGGVPAGSAPTSQPIAAPGKGKADPDAEPETSEPTSQPIAEPGKGKEAPDEDPATSAQTSKPIAAPGNGQAAPDAEPATGSIPGSATAASGSRNRSSTQALAATGADVAVPAVVSTLLLMARGARRLRRGAPS